MPTLKQKLAAKCEALGVSIEYIEIGMCREILVAAPEGHKIDEDLHEYVVSGYKAIQSWEEFRTDMLERLEYAQVNECTQLPCDWCERYAD